MQQIRITARSSRCRHTLYHSPFSFSFTSLFLSSLLESPSESSSMRLNQNRVISSYRRLNQNHVISSSMRLNQNHVISSSMRLIQNLIVVIRDPIAFAQARRVVNRHFQPVRINQSSSSLCLRLQALFVASEHSHFRHHRPFVKSSPFQVVKSANHANPTAQLYCSCHPSSPRVDLGRTSLFSPALFLTCSYLHHCSSKPLCHSSELPSSPPHQQPLLLHPFCRLPESLPDALTFALSHSPRPPSAHILSPCRLTTSVVFSVSPTT
jgi:hypothetical protein